MRDCETGKPTVFPVLPPRENRCFPDPFPTATRTNKKPKETNFLIVRVAVIETASYPWEGHVLPLNHTRIFLIIS